MIKTYDRVPTVLTSEFLWTCAFIYIIGFTYFFDDFSSAVSHCLTRSVLHFYSDQP